MKVFRFKLETTGKKVSCYECGKKRAVAFIDTKTGERLPAEYCKCDREANCQYFLSPYHDGYAQRLWESEHGQFQRPYTPASKKTHFKPVLAPAPSFDIPVQILKETLNSYEKNVFVSGLVDHFGSEAVTRQIERYFLGTNVDLWSGACTFPFISIQGAIRAIQVKLFERDLHTAKRPNKEGELESCTIWLHSILKYMLKKKQQPFPDWLTDYEKNERKITCFFGEHLLDKPENRNKNIAIVEAPKTAIIASLFFEKLTGSKDFVWLAVGALGYLTPEKCSVLKNRKVVLYPDLNAFEKWSAKANELKGSINITVSDLLERKASPEEKLKGLDLADYLLRMPVPDSTNEQANEMPGICSDDVLAVSSTLMPSKQFPNTMLTTLRTAKGYYEVLLNKDWELIEPNQYEELVKPYAEFFEKDLQPFLVDNVQGWGKIIKLN